MEENEVESNCSIINFLLFAEYYLMREGLPDQVAYMECRGNASILLVGCVSEGGHLRARR